MVEGVGWMVDGGWWRVEAQGERWRRMEGRGWILEGVGGCMVKTLEGRVEKVGGWRVDGEW